jgi:hypothetical protein
MLVDTVIELPSVQETVTFTFTPENDAIVRIEFLLGGSRAGVFLDDISFSTGKEELISVQTAYIAPSASVFSVCSRQGGVAFTLPAGRPGTVRIYDLHGKLLSVLSGKTAFFWNGTDSWGRHFARGSLVAVYTSRGTRPQAKRFMLP